LSTTTTILASTERVRRVFGQLALAASAFTFVVIVASAFIRHTQAGLSCGDWPACYAPVDANENATASVSIARIIHRIAATGALVLVGGLWLSARARGAAFLRERRLALAALVIAAALGVLGVATPGATVPAVQLGNLIGGYLMLAMLAALAGAAAVGDHRGTMNRAVASRRRFAVALLVLTVVQASIGGLIGTGFALTSCPDLLRCSDVVAGSAAMVSLDPFQPLSAVNGHVVSPSDAAAFHIVHRLLAIAATGLTLLLAYVLRSRDPRACALLTALALSTPLLGIAAILAMPVLAVTVLHNAAAALLIATLAYVAATS
jgi:cytochrome c oxidase assembly protein subunit 15